MARKIKTGPVVDMAGVSSETAVDQVIESGTTVRDGMIVWIPKDGSVERHKVPGRIDEVRRFVARQLIGDIDPVTA